MYLGQDLPEFGSSSFNKYYIENTPLEIGIESTVTALQEFIKEFGSQDDYTKLVMEIILEELFEKKLR